MSLVAVEEQYFGEIAGAIRTLGNNSSTYTPAQMAAGISDGMESLLERVAVNKTVSGAVASFTDGAEGVPVKDLSVQIEPAQTGSGDPSPENVMPISGWTGAKVTVSPTQDAQDGTTYDITFPSSAGTVYGGTLDVTTGVLTVDRALYIPSGAERFIQESNRVVFQADISCRSGTQPVDCSDFSNVVSAASRYIYVPTTSMTTDDMRDYFINHQVQFVYYIYQAVAYQLTPQQVTTLAGANNVWADTGDVSVTYRAAGNGGGT